MTTGPTSGHRGSASRRGFNEGHILATTQAICLYRAALGFDGPLFLGLDTHALSEPAWASALEVLAANDVTVVVDAAGGYTSPGSSPRPSWAASPWTPCWQPRRATAPPSAASR